ncbi:hypothetical protein CBR_g31387 [Chara braunii]|uniref:Reverse transcriptase domain-containing protein n=1 Tax=Chara braunii TaxID=69332 RepID=A0A388LEW4_CHABU|nr:hypothetical protein CBR_g31387 [Chara braunii]|eukprot:GBG80831.1 hypothetical protein CBR_g31387 [Chara braunii]
MELMKGSECRARGARGQMESVEMEGATEGAAGQKGAEAMEGAVGQKGVEVELKENQMMEIDPFLPAFDPEPMDVDPLAENASVVPEGLPGEEGEEEGTPPPRLPVEKKLVDIADWLMTNLKAKYGPLTDDFWDRTYLDLFPMLDTSASLKHVLENGLQPGVRWTEAWHRVAAIVFARFQPPPSPRPVAAEEAGHDGAERSTPVLQPPVPPPDPAPPDPDEDTPLDQEQRLTLDRPLSKEEIWAAMEQMENEKTPGVDGLPKEFWETFWPQMASDLMDYYNSVWETGNMGEVVGKGVLTLLHKKGDMMDIRNYRPITLLTVVYKMLAKALANRLIPVLDQIIHPTQTGFVKSRRIQDNILLVNELLKLTRQDKQNLAVVFIDFEKAYDHVDWLFLDRCMEKMNIGPVFRRWTEILHHNATTCVQINGSLAPAFPLQRSVRQGDPLAPFLFIIVMEALAANLRANKNLRKLQISAIPEEAIPVCSMFADDLTLMVDATAENMEEIRRLFDKFTAVCTARLLLQVVIYMRKWRKLA